MNNFFIYLLVMAGVTYLVRALPLVLVKKKITNRFILSFLYYMPYTVLTVITVPAVFYATGNIISGVVGFAVAVIIAYKKGNMLLSSAGACLGVFICEYILSII